MVNKKQKKLAQLERENAALAQRVHNQRTVISATQNNAQPAANGNPHTVLNRTRAQSILNQGQMTGNLNTPQVFSRTNRGVIQAGGVVSTREHALLWKELGNSDDGRAWALAALHPCHEALPPLMGIPDKTAIPIATPSYRNTSNIAMPTSLSDTIWDLQVVFLPIPEVDYVWRARANAATEWQQWQLVRPAAFPGNANGTAVTMGSVGYTKYRMMGRGYTIHHLASNLANQGLVIAGQISGLELDFESIAVEGAGSPPSSVNQTDFKLPSGPQQLVQMDNLTTEWRAEKGVYMPLRFDQTVELYRDCGAGGVVIGSGTPASNTPQTYATITSATTEGGVPEINIINSTPTPTFTAGENLPTANQMIYGASQAANQLIGVVFFSGIDKSATIQIKSRTHIEAQAAVDGYSIQPFVHSSPILDDKAMSVVALVGQVQKHAYYAEYNDLGQMMKSIWNAIWPIGKSVASGALSFVPGIGGGLSSAAGKVKNPFAGSDWWSNL